MRVRPVLVPVAVALALTGCGVDSESSPRFREREDIPFGLAEASSTTTSSVPDVAGGPPACFVDGEVIVRRPSGAQRLVDRLRALPDESAGTGGLTTVLADPSLIVSATVSAGVAEIALAEPFVELPSASQRLAAGQMVCTATSTPGIGQVRFVVDGAPLSMPRGDGSLTSEPLALDDYEDLIDDEG